MTTSPSDRQVQTVFPLLKASQAASATAGFPSAPVASASIIGGYALARATGKRPLGGAALAVGGGWCTLRWQRQAGTPMAAALLGIYLAAFGASHPLARRVGAWPSVLGVSAAVGAATWTLADRRR